MKVLQCHLVPDGTERTYKYMSSKHANHSQKSLMGALRNYLNENRCFFAIAFTSVLGDERSAELLAELVR